MMTNNDKKMILIKDLECFSHYYCYHQQIKYIFRCHSLRQANNNKLIFSFTVSVCVYLYAFVLSFYVLHGNLCGVHRFIIVFCYPVDFRQSMDQPNLTSLCQWWPSGSFHTRSRLTRAKNISQMFDKTSQNVAKIRQNLPNFTKINLNRNTQSFTFYKTNQAATQNAAS